MDEQHDYDVRLTRWLPLVNSVSALLALGQRRS